MTIRNRGWLTAVVAMGLAVGSASAGSPEAVQALVPDLHVVGFRVDDADPMYANGDGGLQPGETAYLQVYLSNQGTQPATGVTGQLFEVTDHPDVDILDKFAFWNDLPATGVPSSSYFRIHVAPTRPCDWAIPLRLELTADGGYSETRTFVVELVDPHEADLALGAGRPMLYGATMTDNLGVSSATGDLNGDGFDEVLLTSPNGDGPSESRPTAGEITIIYGSPAIPGDIDLGLGPLGPGYVYGPESGDALSTVATGDLDGDGYADLVAGMPAADGISNTKPNSGEVWILYGGTTHFGAVDLAAPPGAVARIVGRDAGDALGYRLATGDLDGDGFTDLVAAATGGAGPTNARSAAGEVVIYYGGPDRPTSVVDLALSPPRVAVIYGVDMTDNLGTSVATGDLDGDGYDDLLIGAGDGDGPGNGRLSAGEVAVLYGGPARWSSIDLASPPSFAARIYGTDPYDGFGQAVAAGDLDGDGFDDLVASANAGDGPANARDEAGEVAILHGGPTRLGEIDLAAVPLAATWIYGAEAGDQLGFSLATGDRDGDGFDDLAAGVLTGDGPGNLRPDSGEVVLLHGGPLRWSDLDLAVPSPEFEIVFGRSSGDRLGGAVAMGDLNGDGFDEAILSATLADGPTGSRISAGEAGVLPGAPRDRYRHDPETFAFIDATLGTDLGLACDDCGTIVPIGFEFDFFGRKKTEVTVSSNGYLTFGGPGNRLPAFCPPRSGLPNDLIAAFWDDLDPSSGGAVYALLEGVEPNRRLTIEWVGVPLFGGIGDATFEVTLFETSDRIVMQYQDVTFGAGEPDNGGTAIVGLENAPGRNGAAFSCFAPDVANGSARSWRRFASPKLIFADDAESGSGGFTPTGLWHQEQESTSLCSPASRSGDWSWYYGQSASCDYDTGVQNAGTLTTPVIPALSQDARLTFWQRRQTEGAPGSYDISTVEAQGDGGGFVPLAAVEDESNVWRFTEDLLPPDPPASVFSSLDLSAFTGQDLEARFSFDTVDDFANTNLGWMIDDVAIHACPVFGTAGTESVAAEARATAQPAVICDDMGSRVDAVGSFCAACPLPLAYQWAEDGAPIGGATGVTYDVAPGHPAGTFDFTVSVSCPASPLCAASSDPAQVTVVARPEIVGPTLEVTAGGGDLQFHWTDVAGSSDYVVLSGTDPSAPLPAAIGSASSGTTGLSVPLPVGDLLFFRVAGRNPVCGVGPQG